jgi:hypothetical protein
VGPRAGLDAGARRKILCPCRGSNPGRVTYLTLRKYSSAVVTFGVKEMSDGLSRRELEVCDVARLFPVKCIMYRDARYTVKPNILCISIHIYICVIRPSNGPTAHIGPWPPLFLRFRNSSLFMARGW